MVCLATCRCYSNICVRLEVRTCCHFICEQLFWRDKSILDTCSWDAILFVFSLHHLILILPKESNGNCSFDGNHFNCCRIHNPVYSLSRRTIKTGDFLLDRCRFDQRWVERVVSSSLPPRDLHQDLLSHDAIWNRYLPCLLVFKGQREGLSRTIINIHGICRPCICHDSILQWYFELRLFDLAR